MDYSNIYIFILFQGTPCDLLTGEERKYIKGADNPANHLSCSVEMVNLNSNCKCQLYFTTLKAFI